MTQHQDKIIEPPPEFHSYDIVHVFAGLEVVVAGSLDLGTAEYFLCGKATATSGAVYNPTSLVTFTPGGSFFARGRS